MAWIVKHERWKCIGCGNCVANCGDFWEMSKEDHKSVLKGGKAKEEDVDGEKHKVFYLDIKDEDKDCNQEASDNCPADCIQVVEKK